MNDGKLEGTVPRDEWNNFHSRFGPSPGCLDKCFENLFDADGVIFPWFHGNLSKDDIFKEHRLSAGNFVIRYSPSARGNLALTYTDTAALNNSLIFSCPKGWYVNDKSIQPTIPVLVKSLKEVNLIKDPITSKIHTAMKAQKASRTEPAMSRGTSSNDAPYSHALGGKKKSLENEPTMARTATDSPYAQAMGKKKNVESPPEKKPP